MPKLEAWLTGTAMEGDHLAHVHAIHMVGGENRDEIGGMCLQHVQVLVDRVRGALELAAQGIGARQQGLDGAFAVGEPRRPGRGDVVHQRFGLVLRQNIDGRDPGVDQVAQYEIHQPVAAREGHGWLGMLGGQRVEPRPFAACQNHRDNIHTWRPFFVNGICSE
jgi:hypothetical protein